VPHRGAYALVLLLALELAVWECFLINARLLGHPTPFAPALAVVANVLLARHAARAAGTPLGAIGPAIVWLVVVLVLSLPGPFGDTIVPGNARGVLFLVLGMVSAVGAVSLGSTKRASRASPQAQTGR
jgi:cytochrome b